MYYKIDTFRFASDAQAAASIFVPNRNIKLDMTAKEQNSIAGSSNVVDREDVLLLIFDAFDRVIGRTSFNGVTRLEKLIFLLGEEAGLKDISDLFQFRAYKFGPYSKGVYEAADFLQGIELVNVEERPYLSYFYAVEQDKLHEEVETDEDEVRAANYEKLFRLTEQGKEVAAKLRQIWANERPEALKKIDGIVERYGPLPLNQIIRYVYRRFPAMAQESIHPEARRLPAQ